MTATPDTDHGITDEQQEAIGAALAQYAEAAPFPANALQDMIDDLLPVLAAIRRQAAADALTEQARRINKQASFYEEMRRSAAQKGNTDSYETWSVHASQARNDATSCLQAARDKIAEGWAHICAAQTWATRDDPGYGCDTPVENEGDYCPRHEPEDDEDRWAEK
jgi:hypothetical protein